MNNKHFDFKDLMQFGMFILSLLTFIYLILTIRKDVYKRQRSGDREEFLWAKEGHVTMHPFDLNGLEDAIAALKGKPVYFT